MKKALFSLTLVLLCCSLAFAQENKSTSNGYMDFDGPVSTNWGYIGIWNDTLNHPNSKWQIGKPQKTVFTSARSVPNALVTDTVNTYATNDTSVFYIKQVAFYGNFHPQAYFSLEFAYNVHSDTIADHGMIEISPDNGINWIDVLQDTLYNFFPGGGKPILSGNSGGWQYCDLDYRKLGDSLNVQVGDTILLRFSFISDAIETNKDGLMFDDLLLTENYESGVHENGLAKTATIAFPNPANDAIKIQSRDVLVYRQAQVVIYDLAGKKIERISFKNSEPISIKLDSFVPGGYSYTVSYDGEKTSSGRFTVVRDR